LTDNRVGVEFNYVTHIDNIGDYLNRDAHINPLMDLHDTFPTSDLINGVVKCDSFDENFVDNRHTTSPILFITHK